MIWRVGHVPEPGWYFCSEFNIFTGAELGGLGRPVTRVGAALVGVWWPDLSIIVTCSTTLSLIFSSESWFRLRYNQSWNQKNYFSSITQQFKTMEHGEANFFQDFSYLIHWNKSKDTEMLMFPRDDKIFLHSSMSLHWEKIKRKLIAFGEGKRPVDLFVIFTNFSVVVQSQVSS